MAQKRLKVYDFELRQTLFAEIYLRYSEPKSRRRAFAIMEAAITCIAKQGYDGVTLQMVARTAGITRPLVRHYFRDLKELLKISTQYIRLLFQRLAIDALLKSSRPDEMLGHYIDACFFWLDNFKTHAQVWFAFLLHSSRSKKRRGLNTAAVQRGEERIQALIERGLQEGRFEAADAVVAAKMVQSLITGGLVTYISEDLPDARKYVRDLRAGCFRLISAP